MLLRKVINADLICLVSELKKLQQKRLKVTFVDDDDDESSVSM